MIRRLLCRIVGHDWSPTWLMVGKTIAVECDRCGHRRPALLTLPLGNPRQRRRGRVKAR